MTVTCGILSDQVEYAAVMSDPLTINPAHLADGGWEAVRDFLETAKENGETDGREDITE